MVEITPFEMDYLVAAWLRLPGFFRESARYVEPQHFDPAREGQYLVIWLVLSELYKRSEELTCDTVLTAAYALISSGQVTLMPGQAEDVLTQDDTGLIYAAYSTSSTQLQLFYARDVLQKFLHERSVLWPMRRVSASSGTATTKEALSIAIERLSMQQRRISAVQGLPTRPPAPLFGTPLPPASIYHPTGLEWVDRQVRGQREGDVNSFLGFQGAGKSLFSGQLVVESGRVAHAVNPASPEWSTLFTYEEPLRKIEPRLRSVAMRIDRTKLDTMGSDWSLLTSMSNLAHYERNMGTCERERYDMNRDWFNNCVRAFDMSGSEDFPSAGAGGVQEIVGYLDALQNESGRGIRTVVIDWAMPLVERHMEERRVKQDFLRNQLAKLGDELRRQVAERFHCTVWITQQLKSDLNKNPTKLHNHTDAMECKGFAMHMPLCGVLSAPCLTTGVRRFHWSKHRTAADEQIAPLMLKPDSHIAEFVNVSNRYTVDSITQTILETRTANAVLGVGA